VQQQALVISMPKQFQQAFQCAKNASFQSSSYLTLHGHAAVHVRCHSLIGNAVTENTADATYDASHLTLLEANT
jgi:hypothetical protein